MATFSSPSSSTRIAAVLHPRSFEPSSQQNPCTSITQAEPFPLKIHVEQVCRSKRASRSDRHEENWEWRRRYPHLRMAFIASDQAPLAEPTSGETGIPSGNHASSASIS